MKGLPSWLVTGFKWFVIGAITFGLVMGIICLIQSFALVQVILQTLLIAVLAIGLLVSVGAFMHLIFETFFEDTFENIKDYFKKKRR